jgi:predicted MFS family arabinose efflux permease
MKTTMDARIQDQPISRLWTANYTRAWVANFLLFFSFMLMTPLFPVYLSSEFGADKDTIGWVMAGYSITAVLARFVSGYLVDSFPRMVVLVVSYLLFTVCTGAYLLAGSLLAFAVLRTLHGAPFGATTVANSTVAVDSLPFSRRAEGIGYYGLSNNVASALAPSVGLAIYGAWSDFDALMWLAVALALAGLLVTYSTRLPRRPRPLPRKPFSFRGLLLWKGWSQGLSTVCFAFAYGVISTYVALYSIQELGITHGMGLFFLLFSVGLITSRLIGSRTLRQGKIVQNAVVGTSLGLVGYMLFAGVHAEWALYVSALICGLGNGHFFPAVQNMFINMCSKEERGTANSTLFVSWDIGAGLGTLLGGVLSEAFGFGPAFWVAALVNLAGAVLFLMYGCYAYRRAVR